MLFTFCIVNDLYCTIIVMIIIEMYDIWGLFFFSLCSQIYFRNKIITYLNNNIYFCVLNNASELFYLMAVRNLIIFLVFSMHSRISFSFTIMDDHLKGRKWLAFKIFNYMYIYRERERETHAHTKSSNFDVNFSSFLIRFYELHFYIYFEK